MTSTAPLLDLADEVLLIVLSHLDHRDVCQLALVSSRFTASVVADEALWESIYRRRWRKCTSEVPSPLPSEFGWWRQEYSRRHRHDAEATHCVQELVSTGDKGARSVWRKLLSFGEEVIDCVAALSTSEALTAEHR